MPNKNYLRGRRLEWQAKKDLEELGFHVMRASGSHGVFDLVAVKKEGIRTWVKFIQCKAIKSGLTSETKRLLRDFEKNSPIRSSYTDVHYIDVELYIKPHGTKAYTVFPLES